jgi:hypothetical protein
MVGKRYPQYERSPQANLSSTIDNMNGFINHIIGRHLSPANTVSPRLPGRFEPVHSLLSGNISANFPLTPGNAIQNDLSSTEEGYSLRSTPVQRDRPGMPLPFAEPAPAPAVRIEPSTDPGTGKTRDNNSYMDPLLPRGERQIPKDTFGDGPLKNAVPVAFPADQARTGRHFHDMPDEKEDEPSRASPFAYPKILPFRDNEKKEKDPSISSPSAGMMMPDTLSLSRPQPIARGQTDNLPAIKVFIGRIEVRAITTQGTARATRTTAQQPKMSLEDYLNNRNGVRS